MIDVGEAEPRQVVSGLVPFIPIERMQDRLVLVVCNMKPGKLVGVISYGMVLCVGNEDHTEVDFVEIPEGSKPGDRVICPGFEGEPDDVLNPKKKVVETVKPDLKVKNDLIAYYKDSPLTINGKNCTSTKLIGPIS